MSTQRQSLYNLVRTVASAARDVILGIFGLLCLGLGIAMVLADRLPAAGTLFTAGLLLCIFSSLSRFRSVKGFGIEAEMAVAELNNKLNEAEQLLKHIRDIAGLMADVSFQTMALTGFWDRTFPKQRALILADAFRAKLRDLGESEAEINKLMGPWHESNIHELAQPIYKAIQDFIQLDNQRLTERAQNLPKPIDAADPEFARINELLSKNGEYLQQLAERWVHRVSDLCNEAERLINTAPAGTAEEKQTLIRTLALSIDDARYYVANKEFRDRQRWISAQD